jgi:hypothetical protein
MENLSIASTHENSFTSPEVNFNAETGICELKGDSFMNNVVEFYEPVITWLRSYVQSGAKAITFRFRLKYYNSSSSIGITAIMEILKKFENEGGDTNIEWYYDKFDEETEEDVTDFAIASGVSIKLIPNE